MKRRPAQLDEDDCARRVMAWLVEWHAIGIQAALDALEEQILAAARAELAPVEIDR